MLKTGGTLEPHGLSASTTVEPNTQPKKKTENCFVTGVIQRMVIIGNYMVVPVSLIFNQISRPIRLFYSSLFNTIIYGAWKIIARLTLGVRGP